MNETRPRPSAGIVMAILAVTLVVVGCGSGASARHASGRRLAAGALPATDPRDAGPRLRPERRPRRYLPRARGRLLPRREHRPAGDPADVDVLHTDADRRRPRRLSGSRTAAMWRPRSRTAATPRHHDDRPATAGRADRARPRSSCARPPSWSAGRLGSPACRRTPRCSTRRVFRRRRPGSRPRRRRSASTARRIWRRGGSRRSPGSGRRTASSWRRSAATRSRCSSSTDTAGRRIRDSWRSRPAR